MMVNSYLSVLLKFNNRKRDGFSTLLDFYCESIKFEYGNYCFNRIFDIDPDGRHVDYGSIKKAMGTDNNKDCFDYWQEEEEPGPNNFYAEIEVEDIISIEVKTVQIVQQDP